MDGLWLEFAVYFLGWCFLFGLLLLFMRGSHTIDDDENFFPVADRQTRCRRIR